MSQVHVDPEKLRAFAKELRRFSEVMNNYATVLSSELQRLGSSWQDQEYEKFMRDFSPTKQILKKFTSESQNIAPKLEKDADIIEEFFKRRM